MIKTYFQTLKASRLEWSHTGQRHLQRIKVISQGFFVSCATTDAMFKATEMTVFRRIQRFRFLLLSGLPIRTVRFHRRYSCLEGAMLR